jgi:hypothetical protein
MPAFVWVSLAVLIIAVGGGTAFAALRGLRVWRALRSLQRSVSGGLLEITRGVEGIEGRVARAGDSAARLDRARRRLQGSLATASLLAASAGDARAGLRMLGFLRR